MPLNDILRKIEEESSAESHKVLREAEDRRKKVESAAREQAAARREQILAEAMAQAEKAEALSKSRADANRRQAILRAKQDLVESVFEEALTKLTQMSASEYRDLVIRSLCAIADGNETVTFGSEDEARLGPDFVKSVKAALAKAGREERLTLAYAASSLGGGFIVTSGQVSENLTFPTLVSRFRDEMEMEVARVLFSS